MKSYTLTELFKLTRAELFARHTEIIALLAELPDDSADRPALLENLRLIRRVLATVRLVP